MELPEVFEASHRLLFRLIQDGKVSGLRVDHPDGLWNPKQYFQRVQQCCSMQGAGTPKDRHCYIVAEKILMAGEELPQDWPIAGTTGYEFLNCLNGLFVASENEAAVSRTYQEFAGSRKTFAEIVRSAKERVLENVLSSELRALANRLKEIASRSRYGQDFTSQQLEEGLSQLVSCFPVYRTYITEETIKPEKREKDFIRKAAGDAVEINGSQTKPVLEFIANILLLEFPADMDINDRQLARDFVMRFQQLTGPVMAKGLEDTAFYGFNRLVSLNEVGGAPERFGISVEAFHEFNLRRNQTWPHSLLATATHDTKRGEDVRARINVLSEMPEEWKRAVQRWQALNAQQRSFLAGRLAPSSNDEYLLYQILVGSWPSDAEDGFAERIKAYMQKATREAKTDTSWAEPNAAYETATVTFIEKILSESASPEFLREFKAFQRKVAFFGQFNSLSQILLKITSPGVPDIYQGTELWDLSLVDPDNRRPVNYELRRQRLEELRKRWEQGGKPAKELLADLLEEKRIGMMKLFVIWRALNFRRAHRELFNRGAYIPLSVSGEKQQHVCAFARRLGDKEVVIAAPRLVWTLTKGAERPPVGELWQDTVVEATAADYHNVFTGEIIRAAGGGLALRDVFASFPVAVLQVESGVES
jgi:(1->4)-alpha-D-glucan 1-alpha-D-glucosylmutase